MDTTTQHVFIIGAKSPGRYGGYETFIDKLTACHQNDERLKYHIACKANGQGSVDPCQIVIASEESMLARLKLLFCKSLKHDTVNMTITKKLEILFGNKKL